MELPLVEEGGDELLVRFAISFRIALELVAVDMETFIAYRDLVPCAAAVLGNRDKHRLRALSRRSFSYL